MTIVTLQTNTKMYRALQSLPIQTVAESSRLAEVADTTFEYLGDAVLLTAIQPARTNASIDNFEDVTSFEAFLNTFEIDEGLTSRPLEHAVAIALSVLQNWRREGDSRALICAIVCEDGRCILKFHVERGEAPILGHNLDEFEVGVLVVSSENIEDLYQLIECK